jgi:exosortase K
MVVLAAGSLKLYYSAANANELRWILWPTARLTELVTGVRFTFESYAGYMSEDRSFLIATSCSGVNFLIAAFVMFALRLLWVRRMRGVRWTLFAAVPVAAYLATVVANTVRITSAMWLNESRPTWFGLGREELHRMDGILVYFGFLMLLFYVSGLAGIGSAGREGDDAQSSEGKDLSSKDAKKKRLTGYLFPLAVYYAMTLGIPMLNGAFRQTEFWEHVIFVIAVPAAMIGAATAAAGLLRLDRERKDVAALGARGPRDAGADEVCA